MVDIQYGPSNEQLYVFVSFTHYPVLVDDPLDQYWEYSVDNLEVSITKSMKMGYLEETAIIMVHLYPF